jgi:hypothetical protein
MDGRAPIKQQADVAIAANLKKEVYPHQKECVSTPTYRRLSHSDTAGRATLRPRECASNTKQYIPL